MLLPIERKLLACRARHSNKIKLHTLFQIIVGSGIQNFFPVRAYIVWAVSARGCGIFYTRCARCNSSHPCTESSTSSLSHLHRSVYLQYVRKDYSVHYTVHTLVLVVLKLSVTALNKTSHNLTNNFYSACFSSLMFRSSSSWCAILRLRLSIRKSSLPSAALAKFFIAMMTQWLLCEIYVIAYRIVKDTNKLNVVGCPDPHRRQSNTLNLIETLRVVELSSCK